MTTRRVFFALGRRPTSHGSEGLRAAREHHDASFSWRLHPAPRVPLRAEDEPRLARGRRRSTSGVIQIPASAPRRLVGLALLRATLSTSMARASRRARCSARCWREQRAELAARPAPRRRSRCARWRRGRLFMALARGRGACRWQGSPRAAGPAWCRSHRRPRPRHRVLDATDTTNSRASEGNRPRRPTAGGARPSACEPYPIRTERQRRPRHTAARAPAGRQNSRRRRGRGR